MEGGTFGVVKGRRDLVFGKHATCSDHGVPVSDDEVHQRRFRDLRSTLRFRYECQHRLRLQRKKLMRNAMAPSLRNLNCNLTLPKVEGTDAPYDISHGANCWREGAAAYLKCFKECV